MALDMNLHHPNTAKAQNEAHAREMLNRTRAWLNCVNLDRSMGSQYGKPAVIRNTDFVAVQSGTWWNSSEYNMEHFGKPTLIDRSMQFDLLASDCCVFNQMSISVSISLFA